MKSLTEKLDVLKIHINIRLASKIASKGIDTGHRIEKGLKVVNRGLSQHTFYTVEGRIITHITQDVLIADGLHYNHNCISIEDLTLLIDDLPK